MRHFFSIAFTFFIFSCFSQNMQPQDQDFESGVVIFGLSEDYDVSHIPFTKNFTVNPELLPELSDIFEKYGLTSLSRPYLAFKNAVLERIIKMRFYKTTEIDSLIEELENRKDIIQYVEKNPIMEMLSFPNDPLYGVFNGTNVKWHLDMILAEGAWMVQQGTSNIKVAVVDNYVWGNHPDLNIDASNLYDALYDMLGVETYSKHLERGNIEIAPLAFMRGRTLDDAFIILDEAQNTTPEQMKMFLTRIGMNSKMIITGDITQIDLPKDKTCGLKEAIRVLKDVPEIATVFLTDKDVVRHEIVQRIIQAYERNAKNKGKS